MFIPFLLIYNVIHFVSASPDEFRLLNDLRQNYDPIERPVANHNDTLTVKLRIILQQIVEVDAKNQMVTLVVWQKTTWEDYKMRWDPKEYGGLKSLQVPNSFLWKPDILLFNSADEKFDASFPVNFVVEHTGDVLLSPPGIVKLSCRIDITWFPYDEQICFMKFGSWSYDGDKVDLLIDNKDLETPHHMDLSYFIKNGEWELLSTPAVRVASEFDGLKYVEVYYKLHMKRRTLYYGLNWLVPSFLITLTGLLGFTLSPECGEKITLQITNLLSVTVFLGMVSAITPPTSESIPVIAIFFSISMALLGASIVVTIWIVNIFYRSRKTHEMTDQQRYIFLGWLPWFLMMSRPGSKFTKPQSEASTSINSTPLDSVIGTGRLSRRCVTMNGEGDKERLLPDDVAERLARHESKSPGSFGVQSRLDRTFSIDESEGGSSRCAIRLESVVKECLQRLTAFQEKLDEDELDDEAQEDWRFMAKVIDRLSLYVFTILFILSSLFLFLATPRIFDYRPVVNLTDEFNQTVPF